MRMSRRTVLAMGGSLVALLSGAALWKAQSTRSVPPSGGPRRAIERVVDHRGWMLTAADKKKLESQPSAAAPPSNADAHADAP